MANFKLTVSDTAGKSVTKELRDNEATSLIGLKVGSETDASVVGLSGKITITGGSDKSGVPIRGDVHGGARKYVLLSKGVGLQKAERGQRVRKLVRGNQVSEEIYQINCRYDGRLPAEGASAEASEPAEKKE